MDELKDGWTKGRINKRMHRRTDGQIDGRTDE